MTRRLRIDSVEYDAATLPKDSQALVECLTFTRLRLHELQSQQALLIKAKNAYIADLKAEIIQGRTGVDLNALFSDD